MSGWNWATRVAALGAIGVAVGAAACGGGGSGSGGGTDEAYVAAVCKAERNFMVALDALGSETDPDAIHTKMGAAVDGLGGAMAKAKPPGDAKAYHDQVVKFMKDASQTLKDKGLDAMAAMEPPSAPADVSARLDKVAVNNKDCQAAQFSFSN